jgi:hypothetical protein
LVLAFLVSAVVDAALAKANGSVCLNGSRFQQTGCLHFVAEFRNVVSFKDILIPCPSPNEDALRVLGSHSCIQDCGWNPQSIREGCRAWSGERELNIPASNRDRIAVTVKIREGVI